MKLFFFRGDLKNFGDELNHWLLPKVFPDFFDQDDRRLFLGIGSILYDNHPRHSQKIVFGSGYGGYTKAPLIDDTWSVYCVRGPRTADACRLDQKKVAGDAAILINKFYTPSAEKRSAVSFMPHWQSINRGNWEMACRIANVHYIDPSKPVEDVLNDIGSAPLLITEAMHGAIVADALRVPWIPVLPFEISHRMKWFDWGEPLNLAISHRFVWPSSTQEAWVAKFQRSGQKIRGAVGPLRLFIEVLDWSFVRLAARSLVKLSKSDALLSSDSALDRVIDKLEVSATAIKRDFSALRPTASQ